ncbi:hypothetical protein TSAR_016142 [Trichomalopsis sarcophagae]|uniref:PPM-type phosphatase domain-containing protein n=1 Tax=Trichomalopsis sarcophagae TaxID=543379 RepID=A0A232EPQ5_9HYME|nr:hypothetical protein TSAR_016142 [Trichomalopsis sarcophagae]
MPLSIGVNLRVTGHCNQGGRKYMEDMFSVAYQQSSNDRELEYAFFGIFDGHGGGEAATFAKENLMDIIVKQKNFWSDNDEDVLKAIRDGYVNTHYAMWRELDKWPRTASGLPSTAGTTASIAFIRKGKIYIGHVGDSGIILGYQEKGDPLWKSKALTRDHKPECCTEMTRIQESGGKVVSKSGVPRVVWNRPRLGHKGPVRRSTHIDEIPFLAVARSLGDLWSYNSELDTFVVSPEPDVKVVKIDVKSHRCLIFGTDGLWNMLSPQAAVAIVQAAEKHNEKHLIASQQTGNGQNDAQMWINPSKSLVDRALDRWSSTRLRADNTSVVTLMLDPPGPTHSEILLSQKRDGVRPSVPIVEPEMVHNSFPSPQIRPPFAKPEPEIYNPFPRSPMTATKLPSYSELQKHPDSSNHLFENSTATTNLTNLESTSSGCSKYAAYLSKEEASTSNIIPNQSFVEPPQLEESIQVAEISSSNFSDEHSTTTTVTVSVEETTMLVSETEGTIVESTLCTEETRTTVESAAAGDIDVALEMAETEFLLEKESWLQKVPEAEKFTDEVENTDLQPIKFSEPPSGPRLRRGVHEPSGNSTKSTTTVTTPTNGPALTTRCMGSVAPISGIVIRQTSNSRRRHSTGAPPNNQRQQQRQRRSLTPKSSSAATTYLASSASASSNRLKRGSKVLLIGESGFDESRVGVGTRNTTECKYEAKDNSGNSDSGEPCLKRRTRSEDVRKMQDENDPANQKVDQQLSRLRWPGNESSISRTNGVLNSSTGSIQERRLSSPNSFKRRNLEKKVTPVKTIRRPSINRSTNRIQMRDSFWEQQGRASRTGASCSSSRRQTVVGIISSIAESVSASTSNSSSSSAPKRWLRSDTIAATPIKTLRSRNVDIAGHTVSAQVAHQHGAVKTNRIIEHATKLKQTTTPASTTGAAGSPVTPQTPVVAKVKSTNCVSTPVSIATPNRTKQSCSVSPVGGTSTSCASTGGTSTTPSATTSTVLISKRAKTPYNPSAISLSTRSRIKRFSK